MARRLRKLGQDASQAEVVEALNDFRDGFLSWITEQNKRDQRDTDRFAEIETRLGGIVDTLHEHAETASQTMAKLGGQVTSLGTRVQNIEQLPIKIARWVVFAIAVPIIVNVLSTYVLHRQTDQVAQHADQAAQQAAASSKTAVAVSVQTQKAVQQVSNAVGATNSATP